MNLTPRYTEEDLERAREQGRAEFCEEVDKAWRRGRDFAAARASDATHRGFWWGFAAGAALATAVVALWVIGGAA